MSRSSASHPLASFPVRIVAICLLVVLACTAFPAMTTQASPPNQAQQPLSIGTWNTMLHPWFPYQADVIKEIGKTNFDVLALQEVWTKGAKDAIVSDPTVKAKYPYYYYAPPNQQFAYCALDLPRGELEDLIKSVIASGADPRTFVQPNKPYDPFSDLLAVGIALRDQQLCLEGLFNTIQGYPDTKSPLDAIDECYFAGCVKYSHGGSPGQLILSKQPITNVQAVSYDTFLEYRVVVYATIAGTKFAFTQFPYNYFEDVQGAGFLQPGAQQPQMAQDIINAGPDYIVGDFNSGPNYQPEGHNLLVANGYHALTNQDTYCPAATHASFAPCAGRTGTFRSLAIDNIYVKNVPACFTPGTFARTPVSDHIGLSICNTAPVAQADSYSVNQSGTLTVAAPGVLGNDKDNDPQNDPLTAVKLTNPAHGNVTFNADGSFTYTPTAGYSGTDSFTYKASDGIIASNVATVNLTITPPTNTAPSCFGQTATIYIKDGKIVGGSDNGKPYKGKLKGTNKADVIVGTDGTDTIEGKEGNDLICGLGGNDTLRGNDGDDKIDGGAGNDKVDGGDSKDTLIGGEGDDTLQGNDGTDTLDGGAGNDRLEGGASSDTLTGGAGADKFSGGPDKDTATDYTPSQGDTQDSIP